MKHRLWPTATALLLATTACADRKDDVGSAAPALEVCLEGDARTAALAPAGMTGEDEAITAIGRRISPVGRRTDVAYFPLGIALSPDGNLAYVVHSGQWVMEVLDTRNGTVLQTLPDVGGFRGVEASPDGTAVFTAEASGGSVTRFAWTEGQLALDKQQELDGIPTDLEITAAGDRLIVVSAANSKVWELDPATLEPLDDYETHGVYPYALALSPDQSILFASHVGDDTVTAISRQTHEVLAHIPVGLNPMGIVADPQRNCLYAANSDSDTLSVISIGKLAVIETVDLSGPDAKLPGGTPNELALSPDGKLLFVSFADLNRVEAYSIPDWTRVGAIPTGFYATGIAVSRTGDILAVASSKGWAGTAKLKKEKCFVSFIDLPVAAETLAAWTATADENVLRTTQFWDASCPDPVPLPLDQSKERVVHHVVLIVRENKTYDAVLGDFERGNGDPALNVFGEQYTPNLHEIAREFANLDNFYHDSQESYQGHTWTTQADCNDFFEKLYPADLAQVILAGWDPSAIIAEHTFFDHCLDHALPFRIYGEFEGVGSNMFDLYQDFIDHKFPFFNLAISDVWKAQEFIRELKLGIFPDFVYIALPNDHTAGSRPGLPTPASMVADNDEATGLIIDAIAHTDFWDSTVVFIIEDDPQGYGGDHVHSHRSVCVAAGPWIKREYTSSVHYSIPALYRTIEMLLRLPPMHKNDAFAPPMYDLFVSGDSDNQPDSLPYEHIPRLVPEEINQQGAYLSEESMALDLSHPDGAPGMGYILWRIMRGDQEPPPYAKWSDE